MPILHHLLRYLNIPTGTQSLWILPSFFPQCMYFGCLPLDTVIVQVQQWGVVGAQRVEKQVLLNGVFLTGTGQEFSSIIQTILADVLLPTLITGNQTSALSKKLIIYYKFM